MRIYKLETNTAYKSLDVIDPEQNKILKKVKQGVSIKAEWEVAYLRYTESNKKGLVIKDFTDFPDGPIFSKRAVEVLQDFFIDGELLPMKTLKEQELFLYNIFPKKEFVDVEKSGLKLDPKGVRIEDTSPGYLNNLKLKEEIIDRDIFKVKFLIGTFVTDKFVKRVLDNNLLGFSFEAYYDSELGRIRFNKDFPDIITGPLRK